MSKPLNILPTSPHSPLPSPATPPLTPPPTPPPPPPPPTPLTPPPFSQSQTSKRNASPSLLTYRDNRKSTESDLVDIPPTQDEVIHKLIDIQLRISKQLEQIAATMAVMTQTINQRMNAESYLIYRKIDRLAETLNVEEVDTSSIPFARPKTASKTVPSTKRSKSTMRK
jgi:hypothetical protein